MATSTSEPDPTPIRVGDPLPAAMGPQDLQRALSISSAAYYKHHAAGKFDRFLLRNPIGIKKFSGRLVQAYLDGGSGPLGTKGRKTRA